MPRSISLTKAFGQQIAYKFIVVSNMKDAVDTWGHQLLLAVAKVTRHILRNKDDSTLSVDNEEKPIKGLNRTRTKNVHFFKKKSTCA